MAMKDAARLVKQYAMVNVQQYQIVATGETVRACEQNYLRMMEENGLLSEPVRPEGQQVSGVLAEIRSAVLEGNTVYFLRLEGEPTFYTISAVQSPEAVILNVGQRVTLRVQTGDGPILSAYALE
jgi:cold shock CspA family protein